MRRAPLSLVPRTTHRARVVPGVVAIAAAIACSPAGAHASALTSPSASTSARIASQHGLERTLPAPTATGARASTSPGRWLIAATGDRAALAKLAASAGGTFNPTLGILSVPTNQAAAVAA